MKLVVEVEPLPQTRPRFSKFGGCYEPAPMKEYKRKIALVANAFMQSNNLEAMTGELSASVRLYRKYKRTSRRYGDCDNHLKAIFDALNGIIYADDSQIVCCSCEKHTDKDKARIEIEIQTAENFAE